MGNRKVCDTSDAELQSLGDSEVAGGTERLTGRPTLRCRAAQMSCTSRYGCDDACHANNLG